ncbi:hypothetical protein [Butyrivibrio fibrisolvens]|uniref:hypothetical protein n=1 Tax=Butyrivibrio fibrisolvens TaxID=831 RepID=UPI0003B4F39D|nr:hypothetical protein [Butyrivibrio fibrisolvens]
MKKISYCMVLIFIMIVLGCGSQTASEVSQTDYEQLSARNMELENQVKDLQSQIENNDDKIRELQESMKQNDSASNPVKETNQVVHDNTIDITVDNFGDYFEYDPKVFIKKNAFGDLETAYYFKQYVLKEEYSEGLDYNSSELYIKVLPQGMSLVIVELDLQNETGKVLEEKNEYPYEEGEQVLKLQKWSESNNQQCGQDLEEFYYFQFGGGIEEIPETQENTVEVSFDFYILYDPEILDFTGSLVYK